MDTDNETAKIAAQELDLESSKECSPETEKAEAIEAGNVSSDNTTSSVEHLDQKIGENKQDVEAGVESDVAPPPVKVPRSQRRGLFGRFSLLAEITEPKHYPRSVKWWITFIIAMAAIAAPMGSAIILRKEHKASIYHKQLTKYRSISRSDRRRFTYQRGHHQLLCGFLHAINGNLSIMVVVLFRNSWPSNNLSDIICTFPALECTGCRLCQHLYACCHASSRRWSSGERASCRCRNDCRYLGGEGERQGHGHVLPGASDGSTSGTDHRRCSSRETWVEEYAVVPCYIRRSTADFPVLCVT